MINLTSHGKTESEEEGVKDRINESNGTRNDGSIGELETPAEDDVSREDEHDGAGGDGCKTEFSSGSEGSGQKGVGEGDDDPVSSGTSDAHPHGKKRGKLCSLEKTGVEIVFGDSHLH